MGIRNSEDYRNLVKKRNAVTSMLKAFDWTKPEERALLSALERLDFVTRKCDDRLPPGFDLEQTDRCWRVSFPVTTDGGQLVVLDHPTRTAAIIDAWTQYHIESKRGTLAT